MYSVNNSDDMTVVTVTNCRLMQPLRLLACDTGHGRNWALWYADRHGNPVSRVFSCKVFETILAYIEAWVLMNQDNAVQLFKPYGNPSKFYTTSNFLSR